MLSRFGLDLDLTDRVANAGIHLSLFTMRSNDFTYKGPPLPLSSPNPPSNTPVYPLLPSTRSNCRPKLPASSPAQPTPCQSSATPHAFGSSTFTGHSIVNAAFGIPGDVE